MLEPDFRGLENISAAQKASRVEPRFDLFHCVNLGGGEHEREKIALTFAEPVLGGNRSPHFDGFTGEGRHQPFRASPFGIVGREDVGVKVRVSDVTKDHVLAGKFAVERFAVDREHLSVSRDGHGEIGAHFREVATPYEIVNGFGNGVPEFTKALAVGGGRCEPGRLK